MPMPFIIITRLFSKRSAVAALLPLYLVQFCHDTCKTSHDLFKWPSPQRYPARTTLFFWPHANADQHIVESLSIRYYYTSQHPFCQLVFCIKNCFRQPCSSSKYSKTVYAIPCDSTYGTPFPIVLNILVKVMSEGRENDAGNVCIANASATYNLLAWYGCRYTSLFPYATVGEYRQLWSRL